MSPADRTHAAVIAFLAQDDRATRLQRCAGCQGARHMCPRCVTVASCALAAAERVQQVVIPTQRTAGPVIGPGVRRARTVVVQATL